MGAIEKNKPAAAESHRKALDDLIQQLAGEKVQWGSDWYSGYGKKNLELISNFGSAKAHSAAASSPLR
jgi:hypothetical protein